MNAIINNLINSIGLSILHSLWQGAMIYAVLFLLFIALPKMTARTKHNLAFGSLLLLFAVFCSTFFSLFKLPIDAALNHQLTLSQISHQDFYQFSNSFDFKVATYLPVIVVVYTVGIFFQLTVLLSSYVKLNKLKKASTLAIPAAWRVIFDMTLFQLKISKKVQFFLSEKVNVPLVIGFFKPVVLFPISLVTQLDPKQVEAILIHELSHIRRNDYLINLIKTGIETLLFFNPFVWPITKFINIEREHACDDMVVNFTGTPLTYAHALLKLELLKEKNAPALSLAATGAHQHLYQRIKRITNMKTNYINAKQQFFVLTLTLATIASLAWINPSNKNEKTANQSKVLTLKKLSALDKKVLTLNSTKRADTDTVAKKRMPKRQYVMQVDGKNGVYNSIEEMPDSLKTKILAIQQKFESKEWKDKMSKMELNAKAMEKKFNSPEWKDKMAKMELNANEIEKKFNSPEWKDKMAKMELNAKAMDKKFNSPEWKDQLAKIELNAKAMEKKFNSPEWKEKMAKMELNAKAMENKFNSPEWKDKMAKMELNAKAMEKKFNSPEWKDKMAKMELNAKAMEKKFNSPEWKENLEKIQKNAEEMQRKFTSPEWKKQMEDLKKLEMSPEYKELNNKYENDLKDLKKAKGIKNDNAFLLFKSSMDVNKSFLPFIGDHAIAFNAKSDLNFKTENVLKFNSNFKLVNALTTDPNLKFNDFLSLDKTKN